MKNKALYFILTVLTLAIMPFYGAFAASPLKPMALPRSEFEVAIRKTYNLEVDTDVKENALDREKAARELLKETPKSPLALRNLGDAYHTLGHIAEYEQSYLRAIEYHRISWEYYEQTSLETRESRNKRLHTIEHIFIDSYELAYQAEQNHDHLSTHYFRQALSWAREYDILHTALITLVPVKERYEDLLLRANMLGIVVNHDERLALLQPSCNSFLTWDPSQDE